MSRHSREYHFRAFQEPVIAAIKARWPWWDDRVEVRDYLDKRELDQLLHDRSLDVYIVSPTDQQGWTIVWNERDDEKAGPRDIGIYSIGWALWTL
jgi:hypothetical protein